MMKLPRSKVRNAERPRDVVYALPCEPDAKLYNGLKMQITPEQQYKEMVENDTITDALAQYNVKGIHGTGCLLSIQQLLYPSGRAGKIHPSEQAVSLSRFSRPAMLPIASTTSNARDKDGNYRQLHTKEAAECIDYTVLPDYRQHYTPAKNQRV